MIYQLGSEPKADLPQLKPRSSVREILEAHVDGEKKAVDVYTRAEASATELEMRKMLSDLRREEEGYLRLLERALENV